MDGVASGIGGDGDEEERKEGGKEGRKGDG
jgi:hypothetical protein